MTTKACIVIALTPRPHHLKRKRSKLVLGSKTINKFPLPLISPTAFYLISKKIFEKQIVAFVSAVIFYWHLITHYRQILVVIFLLKTCYLRADSSSSLPLFIFKRR